MAVTYDYPRPALTTDCVIFGLDDQGLKVLLIERDREPFAGRWAFPGGFVEMDENLDQAAARELTEETGLRDVGLEQLHAFGAVDRDPRERVVTVAYFALVSLSDHSAQAADDARNAAWCPVDAIPPLAFDHPQILQMARERLQTKLRRQPVGREVLPAEFTMGQLQHLYEAVLGRKLDAQRFAATIGAVGILQEQPTPAPTDGGAAEPRYAFNAAQYDQLTSDGFLLDL